MKRSKLLLVEDDENSAAFLISLLEREEHVVVHTTQGLEAVKLASQEVFDGILLDYMLPDIDGIQVCQMIRLHSKEIPIILTTSYIDKIKREDAMNAGFTAFLEKPWSQTVVKTITQYVKTTSLAPKEIKDEKKRGFLWG